MDRMKHFAIALSVLLGWGGTTWAGSPEAGEAQSAPCAACHGPTGAAAILPTYPNLAGQNERYLFRQLEMIRDGARDAPLMVGQLDGKSDEDLADLAAFYAMQKPATGTAQPEGLAEGEAIYRGGIPAKGVAACMACHAPDGSGNAPAGFPRLAGMSNEYFVDQMKAYREGNRATDDEYGGMMRQIAASLSDREIAIVANYVRGLY